MTFGRRIAEDLDETLAKVEPARRARPGFVEAAARRGRRWPVAWLALGLVGAGAVAVVFLTLRAAPLTYEVAGSTASGDRAWIAAPDAHPVPVRFSDGSEIRFGQRARGRVVHVDQRGARLVVERGRVDVSIRPKPGSRWDLALGPFVVAVTGTRFFVAWNPDEERLDLSLTEGSVTVSGSVAGAGQKLVAGQRLLASVRDRRLEVVAEPIEATAPLPTPAASDETAGEPAARRATTPPASKSAPAFWEDLAREGRFRDALAKVRETGPEAVLERGSAAQLMALGDVARLSGEIDLARRSFLVLRDRHGRDQLAHMAAFELGRVAFDQQKDFAEAIRWFGAYLREEPTGRLSAEARGRLMEAELGSGDRAAAARTAEAYLGRHKKGAHAALARKILGR